MAQAAYYDDYGQLIQPEEEPNPYAMLAAPATQTPMAPAPGAPTPATPGQPTPLPAIPSGATPAATSDTSGMRLPPGTTTPPVGPGDKTVDWTKGLFGDPKTWKPGMGVGFSEDIPDSAIPAGWKRTGKGTFEYVGTGGTQKPKDPGPAPNFYFPEFDAPDFTPVDPFSYDGFNAPSLQDAQNEPGYAFAKEEGMKALQNNASARGLLRTGGTLKDFLGWGNRFAEQNYGNVYNRAANTYTMNRNNAADVWGQKNKQRFDAFENLYRGKKDEFSGRFDAAKGVFDDQYRRWRDILDANTRIATGPGSQ